MQHYSDMKIENWLDDRTPDNEDVVRRTLNGNDPLYRLPWYASCHTGNEHFWALRLFESVQHEKTRTTTMLEF